MKATEYRNIAILYGSIAGRHDFYLKNNGKSPINWYTLDMTIKATVGLFQKLDPKFRDYKFYEEMNRSRAESMKEYEERADKFHKRWGIN